MAIHYGKARYIVDKKSEEEALICRKGGMDEDGIKIMYRMSLDGLNSDRKFYNHTQSYDNLEFSNGSQSDEGTSPLLNKFVDRLSVCQPDICKWGRLDWIEDIDTLEIAVWVKTLSEKDIELITLIIVDDLKQTEIAELWGCSDTAISKRMKNIRTSLLNILPDKLKKRYGI